MDNLILTYLNGQDPSNSEQWMIELFATVWNSKNILMSDCSVDPVRSCPCSVSRCLGQMK